MVTTRRSGGLRAYSRLPGRGSRLTAVLAASSLTLVTLLGGAGASAQDNPDTIDERVAEAGDAVADANADVAQAAADLAVAEAQLPPAQRLLAAAVEREAEARIAHEEAVAAHKEAEAEFQAVKQRLSSIESAYEGLRSDVGEFARRAYQMGPFAEMEIVLEAADPIELTDRLAAIRSVSKANNQALSDMASNRADQAYTELRMEALEELAEEKRVEASERLAEAEQARSEAQAAKATIDELISLRDAALAVAQKQKAAVQGQYERLRQEQARIAAAAKAAAERAARAAAAAAAAARAAAAEAARRAESSGGGGGGGGGITGTDGYLWPIPGSGVSQYSGPRTHPVYGYRSCHTGVDVRGGYGTPILAAGPGVVAEINHGGPFGLHTIIAHADGVSSFYAHQSRTNVLVGQSVQRGDVIGFVGSTGWSTGPHLHFEMHMGGVPHNPMGWFGQSKTAITC